MRVTVMLQWGIFTPLARQKYEGVAQIFGAIPFFVVGGTFKWEVGVILAGSGGYFLGDFSKWSIIRVHYVTLFVK